MTAHADWESGVRELHAEAGGGLRVIPVTAADAIVLIVAAALGDVEALGYLRALDTFPPPDRGSGGRRAVVPDPRSPARRQNAAVRAGDPER